MFTPVDSAEEQDDGLVGAVKRAGKRLFQMTPPGLASNIEDYFARNHAARLINSERSVMAPEPERNFWNTNDADLARADLIAKRRAEDLAKIPPSMTAPIGPTITSGPLPAIPKSGAEALFNAADFIKERALNPIETMGSASRVAKAGVPMAYRSMARTGSQLGQLAADIVGADEFANNQNAYQKALTTEDLFAKSRLTDYPERIGAEAISQAIQQVPGAAIYLSKASPLLKRALGLGSFGEMPFAQGVAEGREMGMSIPERITYGGAQAANEIVTELPQMEALLGATAPLRKAVTPQAFAKSLARTPIAMAGETAGELASTGVGHELSRMVGRPVSDEQKRRDYLDTLMQSLFQAPAQTVLSSGVMAAPAAAKAMFGVPAQPTATYRPTPETAEALSRVAAPPQDRMQPVREMLQPNQEQRATVSVAESQAPAAQAGDGGVATARDGGAPDLQQTALTDRTIGLGDRINAVRQLVGPQATEEAARSLIGKMDEFEDRHGPGASAKVVSDVRAVYNSAEADRPGFLDMARGIAREFGGSTDERSVMKSMSGALDKTLADYDGDVSRLKDALRTTIISRDVMRFGEIIDRLRATGHQVVGNVRNAYAGSPSMNGYRDAKINIRMPNGTTTEVQINHPIMVAAKDEAHDKYYKRVQEIVREGNQRGRLTPQMLQEIYRAQLRQREIYRAAEAAIIAETRASNSSFDRAMFSGWENNKGETSRFVPSGRNSTGISPYFMENNRPSRSQNNSGNSITTPPSVQIVTQAGQERQASETDKAYAKRVIDKGLMPADLPEQHERYFNMDAADAVVPIDQLVSTKTDAENAQGGGASPKRMRAAYDGLLGKRDPITVRQRQDGRYDVVDGNGTLTGVRAYGWKNLPVRIEDRALGVAEVPKHVRGWVRDYQAARHHGNLALARKLKANIDGEITRLGLTSAEAYGEAPEAKTGIDRGQTIVVDGERRPTTNNLGKPIHPTTEGIANFWRWFGDSRAVDSKGRPQVVFHGTAFDIQAFDPNRAGSTTGSFSQKAMFFTADSRVADNFSGAAAQLNSKRSFSAWEPQGQNTIPVYLSLKNPMIVSRETHGEDYGYDGNYNSDVFATLINEARVAGNDGVIFRRVGDMGHTADQYAVFSPTQIKSAIGNTGAFSSDNDRIIGVGDRQVGLFEEGGHRVASTGRVYGAPPSARTPAGLKKLRERLWKLANEGAPGRYWYEKSGKAVLDAAEGDVGTAEKIAGLLAIYSAGSELRGNTTMAMKAYYEWVRDGRIVSKSRVGQNVVDRANAWMTGEPDAVTGVKRSTFYRNIMRGIDEQRFGAGSMGATIDMWMARAFGYDSIKVGGETKHGRYAFSEKEVKRLARELGWEPQQVQAAIWVAIKARSDEVYTRVRDAAVEKGWLVKKVKPNRYGKKTVSYVRSSAEGEAKFERSLLDAALRSGTPSAERIADSALDYGDTLAERVAQVSWEALPSTKSDVLPGIHAAPLAQQAEYLAAIDQALRDKNGQDEIAKLVGLAGANTVFGFSGWEGKVGEGAQTKTFVATDRPTQGHVVVTDQARSVINLYAAIRGQLLHQDAVAWHFPIYKDSLKASNGVEIRVQDALTHDQVQALYNEINKLAGHTDYAPIYTETGVRFLNFRDMPNREFHDLIKQAYTIVTGLPDADFFTFRSDGALIAADRKRSTNGQSYEDIAGAAGRPDLQGRIEVLRDRVAAVEARFAEKYGWDKAAGEEATAEQDRAQGVGEASAFYGRNAIDSLEVGSNRADHPAIDYALPRSMGPRRNINPPDSTHQRMLNAAAHDIEAAGFPLRAAMQAVKGVVTYNGSYSNWHAAWLPDHRVVAFSEMRLIEMEGADARQRYLRGWMAHELTHAIDDAGNGSISSGSPRLDFFVAGDTIVTKGDVVTEVAEAYTKGGKIGEFFEYPLAYAKEFAPALMKEELLAQLSRLYTTNKELMRRELPVSFKMMEDWYAQIQPDSLAATRAGLQAALRAPGSGLGGQERQLHGVDQAVSRADRGVLGVGGAGAGVATGGRAAAGGQAPVAGAQPDLFQSPYSGEKYAVNLNLDRYDTAGAIKGLIEATAKSITDKSSRGATATHEGTLAEADRLGISEDQVLAEARKGGKPMSLPEARAYALAVRQLIVTRAEATKHFAEAAFKSGDSQDRAEAMASLYHLAALQAVGMNLSAEAGRLLNSYRILAGVTTGDRMSDAVFDEERQKTAEQVLEQMFGGTNNVDDILSRVALMSTQQLASPKMKKALLSRRPSAFLEIWKAGLLSGPQTHIVNMASNMLTSLIRAPETAVAAAIGKLHGGDKAYFREVAALMAGMTAGAATGARDAWQIIRHGEDANDAGKSETTGKAITGENFGLTGKTGKAVDVAGDVVRTPFRALAAEDAIFKGINRTGTLYALAYRQAIKEGAKNVSMRARELVANPTREMLKAALEDGLYFTFNNQLGAAGQKTLDILHSTKAGRLAQFAAIPFFRTPVNILKFGVHRSPLAPLTQKFQDDFKAGGARRDMALARMMTGTAVMSAAFALAASGLLTGGGEPEKERKAADRLAGWRPYSIRVGDKFFEYRRLEPLGMLLGMAADLYELSDYMSREESEQWLKMAGMAFAQNITSKTFLSGLTNLIKAISEPQQYGDNYIGALTGSFVPGVVGQAARARDPWERDTDPDKNLKGLAYAWDDVKRDIMARIPGQREKLPLRRDALGQPMPLTDSPSMFNPIRTGELRTDDPVAMELANARARVSPAKGIIQNVKLTPEEKEAYGQASGTVARARLERLFASPAYQGLPQFLRDEKISKEMEKARTDVRNAIVGQMPAERRVEAKIRQLRR